MIKKQKGFSLLELLVVIAIIGILMGILFTGWGYISRKQASQKAKLELVGLKNAVNEYLADFGEYPNCPKGICTPGETLFMSLAGFHNENGSLELPPYPSKIPTHLFHFDLLSFENSTNGLTVLHLLHLFSIILTNLLNYPIFLEHSTWLLPLR